MMRRVLIVPAAGLGTRLGSSLPKLLVPVNGVPMIDRLLALYADIVVGAIVVASPSSLHAVERHFRDRADVGVAVQAEPTGMLDAIMIASSRAADLEPRGVWITWCDQVAVHPRTVERLRQVSDAHPDAAIVMPTVQRAHPYIHLERDGAGRIVRVLHRREGDGMPPFGEGDMGLFALSAGAFFERLPLYARDADVGGVTGERNFLPFIPWAARDSEVVTFPSHHPQEAIGVNTLDELHDVEAYLQRRDA